MSDRPEEEAGGDCRAADSPDVGGKVNAIIEAAETAAEEIGQDARREASEVKQQAEQQAASMIEELTREAAQASVEADQYARDMREAADSYGSQHRRSAEEEALRVVAEAQAKPADAGEGADERRTDGTGHRSGTRRSRARRRCWKSAGSACWRAFATWPRSSRTR